MAVRIEKSVEVKAPVEQVWDFLTDPHQVVQCLPGAEITRRVDERTYEGMITVKVGPVTACYKGQLRFEKLNKGDHEAELVGRGQDVQGKGGAEMRMQSRLRPMELGGTEVTVISEVTLSGRLAQFGRGMIQDVSEQVFQQFTTAMRQWLETDISATGTAAPSAAERPTATSLNVGTMGLKAFTRSLGRVVRKIFGLSKTP